MTIEVQERFESRESTLSDSSTVDLLYWINGTDSEQDAGNALMATTPATYGPLCLQSATVKRVGDWLWDGICKYGVKKNNETGESTFQFDTGGGQQKITQSLATVAYGADPPDFKGAIGVTKDQVEGVEIHVPVYSFSETHYIADTSVDGAYKAALFALTGKINAADFRGFSAGEVLFLGASGSKRGEEDWEINFKFSASPNVTGLSVGDIAGIAKGGWNYLWVRYKDVVDEDAGALVKQPEAVYVETVYQSADFTGLGIG